MIQEIYSNSEPELFGIIQKYTEESLQKIKADYTEAQQRGDIRKDVKIDLMILYINKMMELMQVEALFSMYADTGDMVNEIMQLFFYGIIGKDNKILTARN